jgi:adenine deaminase
MTVFKRRPLHEMTRDLSLVALGERPADLVIRNGRWVNVHSGEMIDGSSVAVVRGRIAACGPEIEPKIGPKTTVIDAGGRYLVPGLLDAHVHVESSMLTVGQFAAAVLPHGTTGAFIDPHEIANVLGLTGVRLMVDEAQTTPMRIYVQVPSCVPAAPGLETSGAEFGPDEVAEAMTWDGVIGLGEVMNYPGVALGNETVHATIAAALKAGGIIGGHYASPDLGAPFRAYVAGGPSDCHEGTRAEDVVARVRQGMAAIVREGSACRNVVAQAKAVTEGRIDTRHVLLCTDDRHSGTLLRDGHMDDVVRTAIRAGIPAMTAIQMATLNTAEHFGVANDVGSIAPGRFADILIVGDLNEMTVDELIAAGDVVARRGTLEIEIPPFAYPESARRSVRIPRRLAASDFDVRAPAGIEAVECRVIYLVEGQVLTRAGVGELPVCNGSVCPEIGQDVAHLAVIERHYRSGRIGRGFVAGFGLDVACAVASTVAHDSHNLLVVGTDKEYMAAAANRVAEMGGGFCLVKEGVPIAEIPLPIAGLMSEGPVAEVAAQSDAFHRGLRECGCDVADALVALSFLALPVIPQLRLTDLGLVDVDAFEIVPLFDEGDNS